MVDVGPHMHAHMESVERYMLCCAEGKVGRPVHTPPPANTYTVSIHISFLSDGICLHGTDDSCIHATPPRLCSLWCLVLPCSWCTALRTRCPWCASAPQVRSHLPESTACSIRQPYTTRLQHTSWQMVWETPAGQYTPHAYTHSSPDSNKRPQIIHPSHMSLCEG